MRYKAPRGESSRDTRGKNRSTTWRPLSPPAQAAGGPAYPPCNDIAYLLLRGRDVRWIEQEDVNLILQTGEQGLDKICADELCRHSIQFQCGAGRGKCPWVYVCAKALSGWQHGSQKGGDNARPAPDFDADTRTQRQKGVLLCFKRIKE
eukprot:CAMPEP_0175921450 /NCGR_PEP_ID=MMETSP0108-20121206/13473_1 /TAXON_ID=195067 ORGANISM="Goniomonas pacifica, Strain CCMP1869" /NCGR_SAMPLE_ID=MMETSP0108 /ASSEMBLY_ACC=CAM_ASM_000204 /LENGTH=148 /DNA_ID=CAMNT_0017244243 /DNA_START=108 /DNA_END=555 /DNA_ORIENTATION=+